MRFNDLFKPYSPEIRGDLVDYLRDREEGCADNLFYGPEYFFKIRDRGLIIPELTCVRVSQNPLPDCRYFVNRDYFLESRGCGDYNMSCVSAEKGVYDPNEILKDKLWSISGLKLLD